jgi:hypothetical protein
VIGTRVEATLYRVDFVRDGVHASLHVLTADPTGADMTLENARKAALKPIPEHVMLLAVHRVLDVVRGTAMRLGDESKELSVMPGTPGFQLLEHAQQGHAEAARLRDELVLLRGLAAKLHVARLAMKAHGPPWEELADAFELLDLIDKKPAAPAEASP